MAEKNGGHLVESATEVADLFKTSLGLFSLCHNTYNAKYATDHDIAKLGELMLQLLLHNIYSLDNLCLTEIDIKNFLSHYRENFRGATILPKMHMLEDHVVPWMQRWHVASGLMGEQGAEQIHAHIQNLDRTYCGVADPVQRLAYIMKEHQLQTAPALSSLQPPPAKRKKSF